jgi:hypothetical protein
MFSIEKTILEIFEFLKKFYTTFVAVLFHPGLYLQEVPEEDPENETLMHPLVFAVLCTIIYYVLANLIHDGNRIDLMNNFPESLSKLNTLQFLLFDVPVFLSIYLYLYLYCLIFRPKPYTRRRILTVCLYWFGISILAEIIRACCWFGTVVLAAEFSLSYTTNLWLYVFVEKLSIAFDIVLIAVPVIAIIRQVRAGNRGVLAFVVVPLFAFGGLYYFVGAINIQRAIDDKNIYKKEVMFVTDQGAGESFNIQLDAPSIGADHIACDGRYTIYNHSAHLIMLPQIEHILTNHIAADSIRFYPHYRDISAYAVKVNNEVFAGQFIQIKPDNAATIEFRIFVFNNTDDTLLVRKPMYFDLKYIQEGKLKDKWAPGRLTLPE